MMGMSVSCIQSWLINEPALLEVWMTESNQTFVLLCFFFIVKSWIGSSLPFPLFCGNGLRRRGVARKGGGTGNRQEYWCVTCRSQGSRMKDRFRNVNSHSYRQQTSADPHVDCEVVSHSVEWLYDPSLAQCRHNTVGPFLTYANVCGWPAWLRRGIGGQDRDVQLILCDHFTFFFFFK